MNKTTLLFKDTTKALIWIILDKLAQRFFVQKVLIKVLNNIHFDRKGFLINEGLVR